METGASFPSLSAARLALKVFNFKFTMLDALGAVSEKSRMANVSITK